MRAYRRNTNRRESERPSARTLRVIRELCLERARLLEEVKQLTATVRLYQEIARRAEELPVIRGLIS